MRLISLLFMHLAAGGPAACRVIQRRVRQNTQLWLALAILTMLSATPVGAQDSLSLKDAVRTALGKNSAIQAADATQQAAASKIQEARAGFLPKVSYSESWARSDNPVFVFSSLLT